MELKRTRFDFRPTEGQKAHLKRAAALMGIPVAVYLRMLICRDMQKDAKARRRHAVQGLPRTRLQQ